MNKNDIFKTDVFKTDLKYIYVTRNSFSSPDYIDIWDPNIGIKKFSGCQYFASAKCNDGHFRDGCLKRAHMADVGGSVPVGTAWLVNTISGVWERVDEDMYLLDEYTGEVIR